MTYTVIVAGEKLPELTVLAGVLAAALKLDRTTAAAAARRCWGVLGTGLDEASAAALEENCAAFGVSSARLAAPAPALPPAQTVRKAFFSAGTVLFPRPAGEAPVSPADIIFLAAAPVGEETARTVKTTEGPSAGERAARMGIMAVTGLPIGLGKSRETERTVKERSTAFRLDILSAGGARMRISPADFDFSCLDAEKTYSSEVNFRLLCLKLAAFAPAALKNAGLLAMLASKPLTALPYDSPEDLEKEELRLLLLGRA